MIKTNQKFSSLLTSSALSRAMPSKVINRFVREEKGIAAVEFAIIAPIMITMYFGLAEVASAIGVDRSLSHGTNVAGDLATQQPELRDGEIEEVLAAAIRVMGINDASKVAIDMESFILEAGQTAPVSKGRITFNSAVGNFPTFDASTLDSKLLNENSGVVVTRVSYSYSPLKLRYFDTDITLKETFMLKPRRSDSVEFSKDGNSTVTCTGTSYQSISCS